MPRSPFMRLAVAAAVAAGALALLAGCALTPETIVLGPAPLAGATPVAAARGVPLAVNVMDLRPRQDRVSTKKNSHGHELAPIRASQAVTLTVQQAIETELRARGFAVQPGSQPTVVAVELTQLVNEFTVYFVSVEAVAQVQMTVTVRGADGAPRYRRVIRGEGFDPKLQMVTGTNAALVLNKGLEDAMKALFADADFTAALLGRGVTPAPQPS